MCMYVLISHSLPSGNPIELKAGTAGYVFSGMEFGKYLSPEDLSKERHIPIIPILVSGKRNQLGFPTDVEISNAL